MKSKYIDLMEKTLSAYTDAHILRYFNDVKTEGLTEHGFPRLTADIGILIAHGRRRDLLPIFLEMMEFCCKTIPNVKAANDFSVREIVCCLLEIEQSHSVPTEMTARWRSYLATIEPTTCYNEFAKHPKDSVRNWALFTAVSEYYRKSAGIGGSEEFIELQLYQQLQWLDENGMYRDNSKHEQWQPIMYDLVPRGLFSMILDQGYHGASYAAIDGALQKAGLLTLEMQSPTGEMAFGGRSNQFLHNEALMCIALEYEAKRYAREGNAPLAARFKAASARALEAMGQWLNKQPIRHIKNFFSRDGGYGCEGYAYFDKYMITVASFLYAAYSICDDTIPFEKSVDHTTSTVQTSPYFHKLFAKAGGYGLEFDLFADPRFDANGLGRVHREGAPTAICLSCPCPAQPYYSVDIERPVATSLCSAIRADGEWLLGAEETSRYEVVSAENDSTSACATLHCHFENGRTITERYRVTEAGVSITAEGDGEVGFALPAFCFDGETTPQVILDGNTLRVLYNGWECRYTASGMIVDLARIAANRNGHYRVFVATAQELLTIKIEILKNGETL